MFLKMSETCDPVRIEGLELETDTRIGTDNEFCVKLRVPMVIDHPRGADLEGTFIHSLEAARKR